MYTNLEIFDIINSWIMSCNILIGDDEYIVDNACDNFITREPVHWVDGIYIPDDKGVFNPLENRGKIVFSATNVATNKSLTFMLSDYEIETISDEEMELYMKERVFFLKYNYVSQATYDTLKSYQFDMTNIHPTDLGEEWYCIQGGKDEKEFVETLAWKKFHKRVPNERVFRAYYDYCADAQEIIEMISHTNVKTLVWLSKQECEDSDIPALALFPKGELVNLMKMYINIHDMRSNIVGIPSDRLKIVKKGHNDIEYLNALKKIPVGINLDKMGKKNILALATKYRYENVINGEVALIAGTLDLTQKEFEEFQHIWLNRKKVQSCIPNIVKEHKGYRMYLLDKDDPRGLMLGSYVNCCQHLFNAGKQCAIHGVESPNGGFYAIEKHGIIIAQSWVWKNNDTIVYDNIETLNNDYRDIIAKLYQEVSNDMIKYHGIVSVKVGSGHDDLGVDRLWNKCEQTPLPSGYDGYTDAKEQYLIGGNNG